MAEGGIAHLVFHTETVQHERSVHAAVDALVADLQASGVKVAAHVHTQVIGGRNIAP